MNFRSYSPKEGSKLGEAGKRVEQAQERLAEIGARLDQLQTERAGLPAIHWQMPLGEATAVLASRQAIEQLFNAVRAEHARAEASLRARERELTGMLDSLDALANRVRLSEGLTDVAEGYKSAAIQQAKKAFDAGRAGLCDENSKR